jgi:hypothetical protein
MRRLAVSASSTAFLSIVLQTLRQSSMDDKSNVFLIDAKTKCYGRYNNMHFVAHPSNLHLFSIFVTHLSMIVVASNVALTQFIAELFTLLTREAVDNTTLVHKLFFYGHQDII